MKTRILLMAFICTIIFNACSAPISLDISKNNSENTSEMQDSENNGEVVIWDYWDPERIALCEESGVFLRKQSFEPIKDVKNDLLILGKPFGEYTFDEFVQSFDKMDSELNRLWFSDQTEETITFKQGGDGYGTMPYNIDRYVDENSAQYTFKINTSIAMETDVISVNLLMYRDESGEVLERQCSFDGIPYGINYIENMPVISSPMGATLHSLIKYISPELFEVYNNSENPTYIRLIDDNRIIYLSMPQDSTSAGIIMAPELGYVVKFRSVDPNSTSSFSEYLNITFSEEDVSSYTEENIEREYYEAEWYTLDENEEETVEAEAIDLIPGNLVNTYTYAEEHINATTKTVLDSTEYVVKVYDNNVGEFYKDGKFIFKGFYYDEYSTLFGINEKDNNFYYAEIYIDDEGNVIIPNGIRGIFYTPIVANGNRGKIECLTFKNLNTPIDSTALAIFRFENKVYFGTWYNELEIHVYGMDFEEELASATEALLSYSALNDDYSSEIKVHKDESGNWYY